MNYGVGGHYTVHHDYIDKGLINNRIATFLVYLKDVPQGKFMVSVPMIYMTQFYVHYIKLSVSNFVSYMCFVDYLRMTNFCLLNPNDS